MNVPTIGGARGIFEIFVPGVFLLLNFGVVVFSLPFIDNDTKELLFEKLTNPTIALVLAICFGYLLGILLRLFKPDLPDKLSAKWLWTFAPKKHKMVDKAWYFEGFPYIGWIGEVCKRFLPEEATNFYKEIWADRNIPGQNKEFYNFVKTIVTLENDKAANEVYAAESLTRYISGMFYALSLVLLLVFATIITLFITDGMLPVSLTLLFCGYLFALFVILARFRTIRVKEVETTFVASFKTRTALLKSIRDKKQPANLPGGIP